MSSTISFHNIDTNYLIKDKKKIRSWITNVIHDQNKEPGDINFILCSDEHLLEMNREHLDHDYYTDIITFDYCIGSVISGDLFISIDRIKENAKSFNKSAVNELHRVMIHGVLHLIGYKDKTEEDQQIMTKMEDYSLNLQKF